MKKTLFSLAILLFSFESFSQEYSFSAGPTWGVPVYYQMLEGRPSKAPKTGLNVNFECIFHSDKKISWGSEIGFQNNRFELTPQFFGKWWSESVMVHSNVFYLAVKMVFRKRTSSHFTLNPLIGVPINETNVNSFDNKTGIGYGFSFIKKINLNETTFLKLEPKLTVFNVIPFKIGSMTSIGINVGLGVRK